MPWLINAAQVDKFRKSQKSLIILDASLHMANAERDAKQEFLDKHIPGAQFFDIDLFSEQNTDLPHMLIQDENLISEKLSSLGIRNDYKIIFYDNSELHSACRALWMMKLFGHAPQMLYLLDGGLAAWERAGKKTESGKSSVTAKKYTAKLNMTGLCTLVDVKENLHRPTQQVVDLRNPARYAGGPEPRPNLRLGHIPRSYSLPYSILFDTHNGCFLPLEKVKKRLINTAIDPMLPIISTCGSGITAPILDFLLDLLGNKQHRVYDGSWSEWGTEKLYPGEQSVDERPVETCIEEDCPEGTSD